MCIDSQCLFANDFLRKLECRVNVTSRIIVCLPCGKAIAPGSLLAHYKGHFDANVKIREALKLVQPFDEQLASLVEEFNIHTELLSTLNPPAFGQPIKGIKIKQGICCRVPGCYYCCSLLEDSDKNVPTMIKHIQKMHKGLQLAREDSTTECSMQRFSHTTSYFPVLEPPSTTTQDKSIYSTVESEVLKNLPALNNPALAKTHNRDVPPLLTMTRWHEHLKDFYESTRLRTETKSLVTLPRSGEKDYKYRALAYWYLERIRENAVEKGYELLKIFGDGLVSLKCCLFSVF